MKPDCSHVLFFYEKETKTLQTDRQKEKGFNSETKQKEKTSLFDGAGKIKCKAFITEDK